MLMFHQSVIIFRFKVGNKLYKSIQGTLGHLRSPAFAIRSNRESLKTLTLGLICLL